MNGKKCFPHMKLSSKIHAFFKENGYDVVTDIYQADYVILNTCWFDDASEEESLKEIESLYSKFWFNNNKLIIIWCIPDISYWNQDWKTDKIIISDRHLWDLNNIFDHDISVMDVIPLEFNWALKAIDAGKQFLSYDDSIIYDKNLFYIEVSKWCNQHCTYCSIKKAKWSPKSKEYNEIKREIDRGIHMWYKEIFFVSDDCGSYWEDINTNIQKLIIDILNEFSWIKLHINYLEPWAFMTYIKDIEYKYADRIKFMNVPLQSLSQELLCKMNRKYNASEVLKEIKIFKDKYPESKVVTQMIYGFPNETYEEYKESLKVLDIFDSSSFFCFSPKKGTLAAKYTLLDHTELYKRTMLLYKLSKTNRYETFIHLSDSKYKQLIEKKWR